VFVIDRQGQSRSNSPRHRANFQQRKGFAIEPKRVLPAMQQTPKSKFSS